MSGWAVQPGGRRGPRTAGNRWPAQGVETRAGTRCGDAKRIVPDNPGRGKVQGSSGRSRRVGTVRLASRNAQKPRSTSLDWPAHRKIEHAARSLGRHKPMHGKVERTAGGLMRKLPPTGSPEQHCEGSNPMSAAALPQRRAARRCRTLRCAGPVRQAEDKSRRMTRVSGGRNESRPQQHRPARN
jgi:hypothetical protein